MSHLRPVPVAFPLWWCLSSRVTELTAARCMHPVTIALGDYCNSVFSVLFPGLQRSPFPACAISHNIERMGLLYASSEFSFMFLR